MVCREVDCGACLLLGDWNDHVIGAAAVGDMGEQVRMMPHEVSLW
jgi:hypothetical protein